MQQGMSAHGILPSITLTDDATFNDLGTLTVGQAGLVERRRTISELDVALALKIVASAGRYLSPQDLDRPHT
jgi:hypothetical protein